MRFIAPLMVTTSHAAFTVTAASCMPESSQEQPDDLSWVQATRLVADAVPPDEAARLRAWLEATPHGAQALQGAAGTWQATAPLARVPAREWDSTHALQRFRQARAQDVTSRDRVPASRAWWAGPRLGRRSVLRSAAAVAAAALIMVVANESRQRVRARTSAPDVAAMQFDHAGGSAPRTVSLPEGSSMVLAPGSRVQVAPGFGRSHRTLDVSGEAFFTVASGGPAFRVRVRDVVVEDLSTAFTVRETSRGVLVSVADGAVVVGARRDTLREASAALVATAGIAQSLTGDVAARELAWTRGELTFANEPVAEIAARLSRWSGRQVEVQGALASARVTVAFAGEPIADMVQVLATTLGARAERTANGWRLVGTSP